MDKDRYIWGIGVAPKNKKIPIRAATEEELRAQRRSWVAGEAALGNDADEAAYRAAFARGDKEEMARLDAEGEKRQSACLKAYPRDEIVIRE